MSRVEANMPTETERRAAEYLYDRGWGNAPVSSEERRRARETFMRGMRQGFKDRSYSFNWTVWRTEYERTGYPPGSFTPRDPQYRDPPVYQATGGETPEERRYLRQWNRQRARDIRGFGGPNPDAPIRGSDMRGFGQTGDKPNTSEPMRGFGESERRYQERLEKWRNQNGR